MGDLSERERIKRILDEVTPKTKGKPTKGYDIDDSASDLLMYYVEEAVAAILQESSLLARHRKSNIVEVEDLQLILLKKYGIDVPGAPKRTLLHKQSVVSKLNASTSKSILALNSNVSTEVHVDQETDEMNLTSKTSDDSSKRGVKVSAKDSRSPANKRMRK